MKKLLILLTLMFTLLSISVLGDVQVLSNTTTVGTESVTVIYQVNQTSTGQTRIYSDSGYTNLVETITSPSNATTFSHNLATGLTGGTTYYYNSSGTSETPETDYQVLGSFTTNEYVINNSGSRTILGIFVFLLVALGAFSLLFFSDLKPTNVKEFITISVSILIGAIIIARFVASVLIS